jgi:hypothetical protein
VGSADHAIWSWTISVHSTKRTELVTTMLLGSLRLLAGSSTSASALTADPRFANFVHNTPIRVGPGQRPASFRLNFYGGPSVFAFSFDTAYAMHVYDAILREVTFPPPKNWDQLLAVSAVCQFVAFQNGDPTRVDPAPLFLANEEQSEAILTDRIECIRGIVTAETRTLSKVVETIREERAHLPTLWGRAIPRRGWKLEIADVVLDEFQTMHANSHPKL